MWEFFEENMNDGVEVNMKESVSLGFKNKIIH